jgi:hypothetical protein
MTLFRSEHSEDSESAHPLSQADHGQSIERSFMISLTFHSIEKLMTGSNDVIVEYNRALIPGKNKCRIERVSVV